MSETWTVRRVIAWAADDFEKRGIPSARLDAEILAAHALGIARVELYMDLERPLDEAERGALRELVLRRRAREPIAYIVGYRDFYKHRFEVRAGVLVPRPETETLVEAALSRLPTDAKARFLELGVGSGAVVVSLLAERPEACALGVDLSEVALEVTSANAEGVGVRDRLELARGDLFGPVDPDARFDLVVSNPPYIPSAQVERLDADVREHEPRLALDGGAEGLDVHRQIAAEAPSVLRPGGALLVEVGDDQAEAVIALHRETGAYEATRALPDLGGTPRVVESLRG